MSGGDGSEPVYRVRPKRVFGLIEKTFPKTATRWTFENERNANATLGGSNGRGGPTRI